MKIEDIDRLEADAKAPREVGEFQVLMDHTGLVVSRTRLVELCELARATVQMRQEAAELRFENSCLRDSLLRADAACIDAREERDRLRSNVSDLERQLRRLSLPDLEGAW